MDPNIEQRAVELAEFIIREKATVRAAAARFGVSKSTVHKDISERLCTVDRPLYRQVKKILDRNKAERHIRGGLATKRKYLSLARKKPEAAAGKKPGNRD